MLPLPFILFAAVSTTGGVVAPPRRALAALHWVRQAGTESCTAGADLAHEVEGQLGRAVFVGSASDPADFVLVGTVRATEQGFAARIVLRSADGTEIGVRDLANDGPCSTLSESAVLAVALIIDLPTRPPEPPPPAPVVPPPPSPKFRLALGPAIGIGVAGAAAFGGRLGLTVGRERDPWAFELSARAFAPVERDRVSVWSADVSAAACVHSSPGSVRMGGCAGLSVGLMRGSGVGLRSPDAAAVMSADALVRLELALPLGRGWSVPFGADGRYCMRRPTFVYTSENALETTGYERPAFSGVFDVALARSF